MSETRKTLAAVCHAIDSKKGEDLLVLDVSGISSFTDYFVLCSGANRRQNQAISDAVLTALRTQFELRPLNVEGYDNAEWILLDYVDFVVHILSSPARQFYKLEKLWSDATAVEPQALTA